MFSGWAATFCPASAGESKLFLVFRCAFAGSIQLLSVIHVSPRGCFFSSLACLLAFLPALHPVKILER